LLRGGNVAGEVAKTLRGGNVAGEVAKTLRGGNVAGEVAKTLTVAVRDAGSYAKGDTAGASMKPCTLENGVQIMVPTYIKSGQMVVVDTSSDTFVKRHN